MNIIPLEEDVPVIIAWCTGFVLLIYLIFILWKMFIEKRKAYIFFVCQIIMIVLGSYLLINLLSGNVDIPANQRSEKYSLIIGQAGILWALSILFTALGIHFIKKEK